MRRKVKSRGKGRKPAAKKTTKAKAKQSQTVRVNVVQTVGAPGDAPPPPPPPPFQKGWSTYDIVRPMTPAHMPPVNTGTPLSHKVGSNILGGDEAMSEVARSESARTSELLADTDATSMLPFTEGGDMVDLSNMTYAQLLEYAARENISLSRSVRKNKASLLFHISKMLGR